MDRVGRIYTGDEIDRDAEIPCDVCVIGSGSGGAVLAHELTAKGLNVVLLEEGGYHTRRDFTMRESWAYPHLYQEMANRATDDLSVKIFQGRSVGGGTTVNWCASFRTPQRILALWKRRHGVEGLSEEILRPHFEAVERRLHIEEWPAERMNPNNRVLWDGLGKLGYDRGVMKRNVHKCANLGYCGVGCPIDAKQSMLVTYVPDAVEKGLTVYANASARKLERTGGKVTAIHVEIQDPTTDRPSGRKLTIRPKVTAVSCGALNSPALLLRSGITAGGRVGRRTYLHPVIVSAGVFDEEIAGHSGAPQSAYSHHFVDRGAGKLGFFLEVAPVYPLLAAVTYSGFGAGHGAHVRSTNHMNATIALTVDGVLDGDEGGTVGIRDGGYGRLKIDYPLTNAHWDSFRTAQKEMARIQFAAGAREVFTLHEDPVVMRSPAEIDAKIDAAPWEKLRVKVLTAHQMGGCAMGGDPATSVVDSKLRVRGMDNLFVVDGSVFPTSLGVNPQVSIFGLAHWASQHVAAAV